MTPWEVAERERRRRRQLRTFVVVLIAIFAVGWFAWDRPSYALGVIATVVAGSIAMLVAPEED